MIAEGLSNNLFYQIFSTQGGYAGVAMFFFLSGYGLMESETKRHLNIWQFVVKRFWKIYKAVLIINVLHYGSILCWEYFNTGIWPAIDWNLLLSVAKLDYHFWFVNTLFYLYLGFVISTQITKVKVRNIVSIASSLIVFLYLWLRGEPANHLFSIPLFAIGICASLYKERCAIIINSVWTWIVVGICTMAICYLLYITHNAGPIHLIANILMIAGLLWFATGYEVKLGFKSFLGYVSFPIYLVHWKVIHLSSSLGYIAPLWLYLLLTIYLAWLLQKTLKISLIKNYYVKNN